MTHFYRLAAKVVKTEIRIQIVILEKRLEIEIHYSFGKNSEVKPSTDFEHSAKNGC